MSEEVQTGPRQPSQGGAATRTSTSQLLRGSTSARASSQQQQQQHQQQQDQKQRQQHQQKQHQQQQHQQHQQEERTHQPQLPLPEIPTTLTEQRERESADSLASHDPSADDAASATQRTLAVDGNMSPVAFNPAVDMQQQQQWQHQEQYGQEGSPALPHSQIVREAQKASLAGGMEPWVGLESTTSHRWPLGQQHQQQEQEQLHQQSPQQSSQQHQQQQQQQQRLQPHGSAEHHMRSASGTEKSGAATDLWKALNSVLQQKQHQQHQQHQQQQKQRDQVGRDEPDSPTTSIIKKVLEKSGRGLLPDRPATGAPSPDHASFAHRQTATLLEDGSSASASTAQWQPTEPLRLDLCQLCPAPAPPVAGTSSASSWSQVPPQSAQKPTTINVLACASRTSRRKEGTERAREAACGSIQSPAAASWAGLSVGTYGHPNTCAPPCKYYSRQSGCKDGARCTRCHMCRWNRWEHKQAW